MGALAGSFREKNSCGTSRWYADKSIDTLAILPRKLGQTIKHCGKDVKLINQETSFYQNWKSRNKRKTPREWGRGTPLPRKDNPHLLKQFTVKRNYDSRYGCSVLVETGTFEGSMVASCAHAFSKVYSIELDDWFFKLAERVKYHGSEEFAMETVASALSMC